MSKGNQKKVGIVATFIGNPEVIILDEPFANLDPTTQIRLKRIIKDLAENRNTTILVSSHDLLHVTEVSERIVVLSQRRGYKRYSNIPRNTQRVGGIFCVIIYDVPLKHHCFFISFKKGFSKPFFI